jgi:hypothetical protein
MCSVADLGRAAPGIVGPLAPPQIIEIACAEFRTAPRKLTGTKQSTSPPSRPAVLVRLRVTAGSPWIMALQTI